MQKFDTFKRIMALFLVIAMLMPNVPISSVYASDVDDGNNSAVSEVNGTGDETPDVQSDEPEPSTDPTESTDEEQEPIIVHPSGFTIKIEWSESEFKDGNALNIYEDADTNNSVKLRVSYANNQVCEDGYAPGQLVITVKGIGAVCRGSNNFEAQVGADKASSTVKNRDWSYTYNKFQDTYTFTNNNAVEPNSVLSGYFDMVWNVNARSSIHGYDQNDIIATLLLPSGDSVVSQSLTFSNATKCDTYTIDIDRAPLYSASGVAGSLKGKEDKYVFIKYNLASAIKKHSRGIDGSETFVFDSDVTNHGSGGVITYATVPYSSIGNGQYNVTLKNGTTFGQEYVVVAYEKSVYFSVNTTASVTSYGSYYEGNDDGVTSKVQLATDSIEFVMPSEFNFEDYGGDIHEIKVSKYEDMYRTTGTFKDQVTKNGGHMAGNKMKSGEMQTYYLGISKDCYGPDNIETVMMVDDFHYIVQKDGNWRALNPDEYYIPSVEILPTTNVLNENDLPITPNKYTVKVYAVQNGAVFNNIDENLVWTGLWTEYKQTITMPANTTAVGVVLYDIEEAIYQKWNKEYSPPENKDILEQPIAAVNVRYALKEDGLSEEQHADLDNGMVVNTSFCTVIEDGHWSFKRANEDSYLDDEINIDLAQKDFDTYGMYLDREKGTITFYAAPKSDYKAYTALTDINRNGNLYTATMTMGADFSFKEDDIPNKFSLYTVLPQKVSLYGYDIEEDTWDVLSLEGLGLDKSTLAQYCTVEIIKNYENSGQTYIALHFDFGTMEIPQESKIRASFKIKIDKAHFRTSSTVNVKSAVMLDKDINQATIGKVYDDGQWDHNPELSCDLNGNGVALEYIAYSYAYKSYTYVDSSQLQMNKAVKASSDEDYVQLPIVPRTEFGLGYSYELSIRNGSSIAKDIVVTDILEVGENAQWQGSFNGLDMSDADRLGLTYTIWYSEYETSDDVGGAVWTQEMDFADVKSIAIDFGSSELKAGAELNIYINMIAPTDEAYKNQITENNYSVTFTQIDASTGNETKMDQLDSNFVQVQLTAVLKNLVVTKVDATSGDVLDGATFSLVDSVTGQIIATETTNSRGQAVFKDIPADVMYFIREDSAPAGYVANNDMEFAFGDDFTSRIDIPNERKTGTVTLVKKNKLDNLLLVQGAKYGLYNDDGTAVQIETVNENGETVMVDVVATTDIEGKITFSGIKWGSYYVQEIEAPFGYTLDEQKYEFTITRENVDQTVTYNITDDQDGTTQVTLIKLAKDVDGNETTDPVAGASFELIRVTKDHEGKPQNNSLGTYVTDANGKIIVGDLAYGDYLFRETIIPNGYVDAVNVSFSITPELKDVEIKGYNQRKPGAINVYKVDNLGNVVAGAVFELYKADKTTLVGTQYASNESGNFSIPNLDWGTYYLKEKSTQDYYQLSDEWIEVVIGKDTLNVDLKIVNETKKGTVVLTKTDEIGMVKLPGAVFTLYQADGTVVAENLTTDENGQLKVEGLEWGSYYFKETKAPVGYGLTDEVLRFAVNSYNAGLTQELYVTDPEDSKVITITKIIEAGDINYANGDPTFLFRVSGTDVNGEKHSYYRIMKFNQSYVQNHTDEDGFVSQSVTVSGLLAGIYSVSEDETSRYEIDSVACVGDNTAISGSSVIIDITDYDNGEAVFINGKYENAYFSDNKSLANSLKAFISLTSIKAKWIGPESVDVGSTFTKDQIQVIAIFDDGSTKELSSDDWALGAGYENMVFPNINGYYEIPVSYTYDGVTKTHSFGVNLQGATKEFIMRLEAFVKPEYKVLTTNQKITGNMFNIFAVYNDGSKEKLNNVEPQNIVYTVTSPNYPRNYSNYINKTWTTTHSGASKMKVVFDYFYTYSAHDYVYVRNSDNTNISSKLYGAESGTTVTVTGETANIYMYTNGYDVAKGFSASIYPLDSSGAVMTIPADVVLNIERAPLDEGLFTVNISLNGEVYSEELSTSVSMSAKYAEPILTTGSNFYAKIPSTAKSVVFTDEIAPETATITDLSAESNGSVVGWLDGTTWKISTQRSGTKVIANSDCYRMFYDKSNLTTIDFTYLDTSNVTSMSSMFYGCSSLTSLDLSGFDTSNVTYMSSMFSGCSSLTSLNVSHFNTSKVTNINNMFYGCSKLTNLNLSSFDTSNVTTMGYMFERCSSLTSLDLSSFDTSNVTRMSQMFSDCSSLTSLDVSNFDTSNVTYISGMFSGCSSLTSLDVSGFDTSQVTNMGTMFSGCSSLTSMDVSNFDTINVTNISHMFANCSGLTSLDLSNFDTSKVTDMTSMFKNCSSLTSIDLSSFDTGKVANIQAMFSGCSSLTRLDLSSFDTSNTMHYYQMFDGCDMLCEVTIGKKFKFKYSSSSNNNLLPDQSANIIILGADGLWYDTVTQIGYAPSEIPDNKEATYTAWPYWKEDMLLCGSQFYNLTDGTDDFWYKPNQITQVVFTSDVAPSGIILHDASVAQDGAIVAWLEGTTLYVSTQRAGVGVVANPYSNKLFTNKTSLTSVSFDGLDTSRVLDASSMFSNCSQLKSVDIRNFDTSNVTDMSQMFKDCKLIKTLDLSSFNTGNVIDIYAMFSGCQALSDLNISTFDTSKVTYMDGLFENCNALTNLDLSHFNTDNVTDMSNMFNNCKTLTEVNLSNFDTNNVTSMTAMFKNCSNLTKLDLSSFYTPKVQYVGAMFEGCSSLCELDIGQFSTAPISQSHGTYAFEGCNMLGKVTVGEAFANIELLRLPTPSADYIDGADGYWYSSYSEMKYLPEEIPSYRNATYYAIGSASTQYMLIDGLAFNAAIPSTATAIVFTDDAAPDGTTTTDVSVLKNGSVVAWLDGTTWHVSTQQEGAKVVANPDSAQMFYNKTSIVSIDAANLNTSCVEYMNEMFYWCSALTDLDISGWNTSSVITMEAMFANCTKLTSINLSSFDTSNVTAMGGMFYCCSGLTSIDLSGFDTSNVTTMTYDNPRNSEYYGMFHGCSGLTSLDIGHFNTSNVTDMSYMFGSCSKLTNLDLSNFNTSNVTNMSHMFRYCTTLTDLNISNLDTSNVKDMNGMFYNCYGMTSLDLSHFNTGSVTDMSDMFYNCFGLTYLDVSGFNTRNVTDMSYMFYICSKLTSLDLSSFDVDAVTNMYSMFCNCSKLTTIYASDSWNPAKVTSSGTMFSSCTQLIGGAGTKFSSSYTSVSRAKIDKGTNNPGYLTSIIKPNDDIVAVGETRPILCALPESWTMIGCELVSGEDFAEVNADGTAITGKAVGNAVVRVFVERNNGVVVCGSTTIRVVDGAYAVYSKTDYSLTFYNTKDPNSNGFDSYGQDITAIYTGFDKEYYSRSDIPWGSHTIKSVQFKDVITPLSTAYWFHGIGTYNYVDMQLGNLDTSNVTDMQCMFYNCATLTSLDLSSFDTSNVTNMRYMFYNCASLTSLDLSSFDTSKVRTMEQMFVGCSSLTSLSLSNFDTSNVTDMSGMFSGCYSLTSIDVSGFDTGNITDMSGMFGRCSSLTSLDLSSFDTSNVTDMTTMFYYCSSLTSLDLSSFDTSNVTDMSSMFSSCSSLTDLDLSDFDTSNITDMGYMFASCQSLTSLDLSSFNTSKVTDMERMFYGCSQLTSLDISSFNTTKVRLMNYMFQNCSSLTNLDLSSFDTSNVTDMSSMFYYCSSLTDLDLSDFYTSKVTYMSNMFYGCSSLTSLYLGSFNTSKVTNMSYMFYDCSSLTSLDLSSFNNNNVTNMSNMFYGCEYLERVSLGDGFAFKNSAYLPDTSMTVIGADGYWYNEETMVGYLPSQIPNNVAATYVSYSSDWYDSFVLCNGVQFANRIPSEVNSIVFTDITAPDDAELLDLSVRHDESVVAWIDETTWCVSTQHMDAKVIAFEDCRAMFANTLELTTLDLSNFDTSNVADMSNMFSSCSGLTELDLSGFDTSNVADMSNMFSNCSRLTELDLSSFDTSNVTNMSNMFLNCDGLTSLDISNFNTSNVTDMSFMFQDCESLVTINMSGLDMSNVEYMNWMFMYCTELTEIVGISDWNTSNVIDMYRMFSDCKSLPTLDLSGWNTAFVTDSMGYMFANCYSLVELDISGFNTSNNNNSWGMFEGCNKLAKVKLGEAFSFVNDEGYLPEPNAEYIENVTGYWYNETTKDAYLPEEVPNNTAATYIASPSWLIGALVDGQLFNEMITDGVTEIIFTDIVAPDEVELTDVSALQDGSIVAWADETVYYVSTQLDGVTIKANTDCGYMFYEQYDLVSVDMSNLDMSSAVQMDRMFAGCERLTKLYLGDFDTSNVVTMASMFEECYSLTAMYDSSSYIGQPNEYGFYFDRPYSFNFGDGIGSIRFHANGAIDVMTDGEIIQSLPEGSCTYEYGVAIIDGESIYFSEDGMTVDFGGGMLAIEFIDLGDGWNTSNVIDMSHMFHDCQSIKSIDVSGFDMSNVKLTNWMFAYCVNLTEIIGIENWDVRNAVDMFSMFDNCQSLTSLDLSKWNASSVVNTCGMFFNCVNLTNINVGGLNAAPNNTMNEYGFYFNRLYSTPNNGSEQLSFVFFDDGSFVYYNGTMFEDNVYPRMVTYSDGEINIDGDIFEVTANGTMLTFDGLTLSLTSHNLMDTCAMFCECINLQRISGMSDWDISNVVRASSMFEYCTSLKTLDLSGWKFSNTTKNDYGFYFNVPYAAILDGNLCTATFFANGALQLANNGEIFEEIPAGELTYAQNSVIYEDEIVLEFYNEGTRCAIDGLELAAATSNLRESNYMFYGCSALTDLDLGSMNTALAWTEGMFSGMASLVEITVGDGFVFSENCYLPSPYWYDVATNTMYTPDTIPSNVAATYRSDVEGYEYQLTSSENFNAVLPYDAKSVTFTDISAPDGAKLIDVSVGHDRTVVMWMDDETCYVSTQTEGVKIISPENMRDIFGWHNNLVSVDLSNLDTSSVTDMSNMFVDCYSLEEIDFGNIDTSSVTDMSYMFAGCSNLTAIDLSSFETNNVNNMQGMFQNCSSLTNINVSGFNTNSVTDMSYLFAWCTSIMELDLSDFDTSNVTNMSYMFMDCACITTLNLTSFNVENLTNANYMFYGCSSLATIIADDWADGVTATGTSMFYGCTKLVGGIGYTASCVGWDYATTITGYFTTYHTYGEWTEIAATCTEFGSRTATCEDCGHVKNVMIAKLAHNYVDGVCIACGHAIPFQAVVTSNGTYRFTPNGNTWTSNNKNVNSSTATTTLSTQCSSTVTVNWSVSSESNYDKLTITVDGVTKVNAVSGVQSGSFTLTPGNHTIVLKYTKDSSQHKNNDCGTITFVY